MKSEIQRALTNTVFKEFLVELTVDDPEEIVVKEKVDYNVAFKTILAQVIGEQQIREKQKSGQAALKAVEAEGKLDRSVDELSDDSDE